MTHMAVARTLLLLLVACFVAVQAERAFINLLPSVAPGAQAIGHENGVDGGGRLNQFGKDFYRLGGEKGWNVDICKLDSDKDGATNGQELGDPDCTWKVGQPKRTYRSHPGNKNSMPPAGRK